MTIENTKAKICCNYKQLEELFKIGKLGKADKEYLEQHGIALVLFFGTDAMKVVRPDAPIIVDELADKQALPKTRSVKPKHRRRIFGRKNIFIRI